MFLTKRLAGISACLGVVMVMASKWQGDALSVEAWGFFGVVQAIAYVGLCIEDR